MTEKTNASEGDVVKVEYKGTFDDGTVFDSSEGKEPLIFKLGGAEVIKGFDDAVKGMSIGDEKEVEIKPSDGYGERNEVLVQKVPLSTFPKDMEVKPGIGLRLQAPTGELITAIIGDVDNENATLDFNHPLAGKTLHFKIKLVGIN